MDRLSKPGGGNCTLEAMRGFYFMKWVGASSAEAPA
jgi:hypothetical protein